MRAGIAGTIVLKFFEVLPRDKLGSIHLFFVFTGLLGYRLRSVSFKRFTKQTEQILVVEDLKHNEDSTVMLFQVIAQRLADEDARKLKLMKESSTHNRSHKAFPAIALFGPGSPLVTNRFAAAIRERVVSTAPQATLLSTNAEFVLNGDSRILPTQPEESRYSLSASQSPLGTAVTTIDLEDPSQ
jgi:hypothetical protein